ncbi:MAG TPA: DMT family transporter [Flavisolibacter sp.]|nr:DMT family transporter [Flavisolibacter sp.]
MTPKTKAHIAVLGTNLFFAANFSLVKLISPALIKPFGLNVFRVGVSLLLFWLVWLFGKSEAGIRKKDISRFLLCGLTGITINQTLFIKGLTLTSTVHASLLILTTPLLITLLAFWVLKEALTIYKALGLALGIGGSTLLILSKESSSHAINYVLGDLLIIINAISYALYFILVKPLMQHYSPLHVIRWIFTFGFFMVLPLGFQEATTVDFRAFELTHLLLLAGIVLTGTFLAYFFNAYGIQHLGAGTTGSYIYTQPVFAVLIATFILHEELSWQKMLAAVLIFSGVFLVNYRKK